MTNVYAFAVVLVIDTLIWLGIIPDPIQVLENAIEGRPRDEATVETINFLAHHQNPAGRLWGVQLSRMLTDDNIVISSSDAASQKMLGLARSQFIKSAILQGETNTQAQLNAQLIMSPAAQDQPIKIDFLTKAAPDGFVFNAAGKLASLYSKYLQANPFTAGGANTPSPEQKAEQYIYKYGDLSDLLHSWIGPQLPDSYTPTGPITAGQNPCGSSYSYDPTANVCWLTSKLPTNILTQQCSVGYQYNPTSFLCEWIPTGQQTGTGGGGQPGGGQPGGGTPPPTGTIPMPPTAQPGGDELNDCCNLSATYLYYVATAIQSLATQFAANTTNPNAPAITACCTQLTAQIEAVAAAITGLPSALGLGVGSGPAPVDLSLIVAALNALDTDLKQGNANAFAGAAEISSNVADVAKAIANAPAPDLSGIAKSLAQSADELDVHQATFDDLIAKGFIAPSDAQFFQGLGHSDSFFHKWYTDHRDLIRGLVGGAAGLDIDTGSYTIPKWIDIVTQITTFTKAYISGSDNILAPILKPLIAGIEASLTPTGGTTIGNIGVDVDGPVTTATSIAFTATIASTILSYFGIDIGESVTRIAELVAGAIGLEQLRDVQIGPLVREGIAKVATMQAKAIFRQDAPDFGSLARLAARSYITTDRAAALAPYSGVPAEFVEPIQLAAYTSLPERFLIQLFDSQLFTQADLNRILTEHGLNAADRQLLVNALPYVATRPQRTQLQGAVESAYAAGLLSDTDLVNQLETVQSTTDYQQLILARVRWELLIRTTKELETSYSTMAQSGALSILAYQAQLEGIGLQPTMVNTLVAVAQNRLAATSARQATAAERALERATASVERRAAQANFASGGIDSAGLALALVATGLTAEQAAAWVDLAVLRQGGSTRLTYGKLLLPAQAQLLRERVAALTGQRRKNLITNEIYTSQLTNLGIPNNWINALLAAADAGIDVVGAPSFVNVSTS